MVHSPQDTIHHRHHHNKLADTFGRQSRGWPKRGPPCFWRSKCRNDFWKGKSWSNCRPDPIARSYFQISPTLILKWFASMAPSLATWQCSCSTPPPRNQANALNNMLEGNWSMGATNLPKDVTFESLRAYLAIPCRKFEWPHYACNLVSGEMRVPL